MIHVMDKAFAATVHGCGLCKMSNSMGLKNYLLINKQNVSPQRG
jgi:hypothetical protein